MINARRILVATALLLICGATVATPAQAQDGCIDGLDGVPVCTPHVGPPPPPDSLRPAPLPPPGYDNSPNEFVPAPAPAPVYVAPAPYVPVPAAPQPAYKAPAAPALVYQVPVPVQGQAAITPNQSVGVPAAVEVEAPAAPESAQVEAEVATTPAEVAEASVPPTATPRSSSKFTPVQDIVDSEVIEAASVVAADDSIDQTPLVVFVALVIAGSVALVVMWRTGGIRRVIRTVFRS